MDRAKETTHLRHTAAEAYRHGNLASCHAVARRAVALAGDDVESLRLAGRAAVELGDSDGVSYLRRVTELVGDRAEAWVDLGDALAAAGQLEEAASAWERANELRPADPRVLTALGHAALATGAPDAAAAHFARAADVEPANHAAAFGLVELHRGAGRLEDAGAVARRAWDEDPSDVLAGLHVAELSLEAGALGEAEGAFARLRELEPEEHEIYVLYGLIDVAIRRGEWVRASELAAKAALLDASGATTDVLIFVADRAFGSIDRSATTIDVTAALAAAGSGIFALPVLVARDRPVPSPSDIERRLRAAHTEHRRAHVEEHPA